MTDTRWQLAGIALTAEQRLELAQALAEADRGEGVDGWQLLEELAAG